MLANWVSVANQPLLIFAITLLTIWIIMKLWRQRKLPPGPFGFPIIGYLPLLRKAPQEVLQELGKKYGKIFRVRLGGVSCIIIDDCDVAKEILSNPSSHGRPPDLSRLTPGKGGFGANMGEEWQEQRRFCVGAMKNLGMGRGEWENMIQEETADFTEDIKGWRGKPTDYQDSLQSSITGNNLSLLIGRKLSTDKMDPERKILKAFVNDFFASLDPSTLIANLPVFLLKLMARLKIGGIDELLKTVSGFENILRKEIKMKMQTPSGRQKTTFIELYLQELEKKGENVKGHYFSVDNLVGNLTALFLGGVDTTKASLHWAFLILASHPEVQQKIHQEIDDVAGRDRRIYWDERNQFPYIMATMNELQRWTTLTPLLPPRWTMAPIDVGPYTIPKGITIIVNGYNLMKNPKYHANPEDFKPERFLKKDDKPLEKSNSFIPFSVGKRNCPGEQVAMMTIFLYLTAILQKFKIVCPNGKSADFTDNGSIVIRHAVSQELCFIER